MYLAAADLRNGATGSIHPSKGYDSIPCVYKGEFFTCLTLGKRHTRWDTIMCSALLGKRLQSEFDNPNCKWVFFESLHLFTALLV